MKRLLLFFVIFLCSLYLFCQEQNDIDSQVLTYVSHSPGDVSVSLSGNMLFNNPFESVFAGGFKMRIFVSKRISFDADILVGKDYIHFGPGIFGLPLWLLGTELFSSDDNSSDGGGLFALLMMIFSAEHITYHFPVLTTTDISPYISLLRFKQYNVNDVDFYSEENNGHVSFVAGVEFNRYIKRFIISPYAEYNISYDGFMKGINFGLNIGYYFPNRK